MRAFTEEEFNEWRAHPVTTQVREMFLAKREQLRQQWEGGSFADYTKDATVLVNVGNLGTCRGYAAYTDLTYEDYVQQLDDGKHEWTESVGQGGPKQAEHPGTEGRSD